MKSNLRPVSVLGCSLRGWLALAVWGAHCLAAQPARAGDDRAPDACLAAYEDGQRQMSEGDLTGARSSFLVCASRACPQAMHGDCEGWLDQVWASMPTVVLRAVGPDGEVLAGARAQVDGEPFRPLNGRAIPLNPGQHRVVVEHELGRRERQIFVAEGEKLTRRDVVVGPVAARPGSSQSEGGRASTDSASATSGAGLGLDVAKLTSGVVAAAGAAGFAYFGLRARRGEDDLFVCSPDCTSSAIESVKRDYLFSQVSLGAGLVGLGTLGVLMLFGADADELTSGAASIGFAPGVGPTLGGRF